MRLRCEAPSIVPIAVLLASKSCHAAERSRNEFEAADWGINAPAQVAPSRLRCWSSQGVALLETVDANQLLLEGGGSFRRTLLASQHGVNCLDISIGHVLVFLASDVRRTQNYTGPEGLAQKFETGIRFKYLRQVVEFRQSGRLRKQAGRIYL